MKVQKVIVEKKPYPLYILLDINFEVVEPVKRFIKYLDNTGKAPNTIKTYCYHLKLFYAEQGVRTTITNYKLDVNQQKTPVLANSYYVTNLNS